MMKLIGILLLWFVLFTDAGAERTQFDKNWKFILEDVDGAERLDFDDKSWRVLDLPHDWSIEGEYAKDNPMSEYGGYLPAGIGWYRKTIKVPKYWKGKHIEIAFDGVFMNSTVWANGKKLGTRPYGWISFEYDISDMVNTSDVVTIAVRVDNEKQPAARWYTGSGIYAHTWINVREKIHVGNNGIFIRTNGNKVMIDTEIANYSDKKGKITIVSSILDDDGKRVARVETPNNGPTTNQTIEIPNPILWDTDNPYLYTLVTELKKGRKVLDKVKTRFGVRDIKWKPATGMWLNGKNVKLQGVCNHQDAGALGAAVPDKILRFRIEQIKAMGCNAIRTTHNPQTPIFYELCDELGMLVLDEIYDGWSKKAPNDYGAHHFDQWWKKDIHDWMRRDRNHPSVIIWSVGNETHGKIAKDLVEHCHSLDPTRPVTSSQSEPEVMDIYGANGSSERVGWFDNFQSDKVMIGTENTHTWQVRGYYRTKTWYRNGYPSERQKPFETPDLTENEIFTYDWISDDDRINPKQILNSSYDNAMVRLNSRRNIEQLRDIPYFAGTFRWTGHDYIGEAGFVHGGWPFKAFMGGAIDLANFEKDLYYLYQSQWTTKPMVHILPHWTHPTVEEGTEIPVWVYSNCDEVELFLNGKSLGKQNPGKSWDKMQCQWMVGYTPGTVKAVAYNKGKKTVEKIIKTADAPSKIALSIDGRGLSEKANDIVQVRVSTTDAKGEFYPYGENRNHFHIIGSGKIRALDNGSPVDVEKHFEAKNRIAFFGLTRAYIESTDEKGDITLLTSCILGEKKQVTSNKVAIDTELLALRGELPDAKIDVFYTTDGSEPTSSSSVYTEAFPVTLGTTVKALILLNGKPVQQLEERFARDEGFVWNSKMLNTSTEGSQAETATLHNAEILNNGNDYHGNGYVQFSNEPDAYVEWYQENDGKAGDAVLNIRYSAQKIGNRGHIVSIEVNGKTINEALLLPNTASIGKDWKTSKLIIPISMGANSIRVSSKGSAGLCLDEIIIE